MLLACVLNDLLDTEKRKCRTTCMDRSIDACGAFGFVEKAELGRAIVIV